MTTRRSTCCGAMVAITSKRCFSTSPAAAAKRRARRRNERASERAGTGAAPHRSHGAALSLSPALLVVARTGTHLLAGCTAVRVGLPPALHHTERRFFRPRRWHVYRRGADVGHPVPRPARFFGLLSRRDVGAQPWQSNDQ